MRQVVRGMTGDRESVLDEGEEFTPELRAQAVAAGSRYVTVDLPVDQLPPEGFSLESHHIEVPTADLHPPENSPYQLREARADDHFGIAVLASKLLPYILLPGREYDMAELTVRSMEATFRQLQSDGIALVLEDHDLVAYLLLLPNGHIYDLGVDPEHWGGTATRHIMRAGSRSLFHRGVPGMAGDVSSANPRALRFAQRALGFSVVRQRYVCRL